MCLDSAGNVCMGNLYRCIVVADAPFGNGTGRRTATLAAPLALTSGLVRYEAVLHSYGTNPVGGGGTDLRQHALMVTS